MSALLGICNSIVNFLHQRDLEATRRRYDSFIYVEISYIFILMYWGSLGLVYTLRSIRLVWCAVWRILRCWQMLEIEFYDGILNELMLIVYIGPFFIIEVYILWYIWFVWVEFWYIWFIYAKMCCCPKTYDGLTCSKSSTIKNQFNLVELQQWTIELIT